MEKPTFTTEQVTLIELAISKYQIELNHIADGLEKIGDSDSANKFRGEVSLLEDAANKLMMCKEWKVEK